MRCPRTRYMLIRVWTWTCFTNRWCDASPASNPALVSVRHRAGSYGIPIDSKTAS